VSVASVSESERFASYFPACYHPRGEYSRSRRKGLRIDPAQQGGESFTLALALQYLEKENIHLPFYI
jgi:hypothetical protein